MTRKIVVAGLLLAFCAAASAQDPAILSFGAGGEYTAYYGGASAGDVVGWRFSVNSEIFVTDLGVRISDASGTLSDHAVGIWDSRQTLLADTTVPAGTTGGDFGYASISGVTLSPGETYTIGAEYGAGGVTSLDFYVSGASSLSTATEVNWLNSTYPLAADMGFVYPGMDSTSFGRFGPSFLFVPEPGTLILLGLGGLALIRRR